MTEISDKALEKAGKSLPGKLARVDLRTEPLGRLVDFLPGAPDPLEKANRESLVSRETWEELPEEDRDRTTGFMTRHSDMERHLVHPPIIFHTSDEPEYLDRSYRKAIGEPTIVFRYKDHPRTALTPEGWLPVKPLLGLVPRLKTTPTEDLPVILNSRLFHFAWLQEHGTEGNAKPENWIPRLEEMQIPMLTKRVGGPFREVRDEILSLVAENAERLAEMDRIKKIAEDGGIRLVPLDRTEGIIREINVPNPLAGVAEVRRRGPVVIFRKGSTIVTTTEEAATYLDLWLHERFDKLRGMLRDQIEEYVVMPQTTAQVVMTLQLRARIEDELDEVYDRIEELQDEAEERLADIYELSEEEREYLRQRVS